MTTAEFLGSSIFRYGVFPILSAASGVALKCVSRNDGYAFFKKEDMAVGPQLMLTAALTYVVIATDRAQSLSVINNDLSLALKSKVIDQLKVAALQGKISTSAQYITGVAWTLIILLVGLWGITTIIKRWGWVDEFSLRSGIGIAFPLVVGIASLMYVMMAATQ